jgi:hypothetical protein
LRAGAVSNVRNLVGELSWVRQRLMKCHVKAYFAELDKALNYLDLVIWGRDRASAFVCEYLGISF